MRKDSSTVIVEISIRIECDKVLIGKFTRIVPEMIKHFTPTCPGSQLLPFPVAGQRRPGCPAEWGSRARVSFLVAAMRASTCRQARSLKAAAYCASRPDDRGPRVVGRANGKWTGLHFLRTLLCSSKSSALVAQVASREE
jgi:hypothetical protein